MGATAFRKQKASRGQYRKRVERRRSEKWQPSAREVAPWYCFPLSVGAFEQESFRKEPRRERVQR